MPEHSFKSAACRHFFSRPTPPCINFLLLVTDPTAGKNGPERVAPHELVRAGSQQGCIGPISTPQRARTDQWVAPGRCWAPRASPPSVFRTTFGSCRVRGPESRRWKVAMVTGRTHHVRRGSWDLAARGPMTTASGLAPQGGPSPPGRRTWFPLVALRKSRSQSWPDRLVNGQILDPRNRYSYF